MSINAKKLWTPGHGFVEKSNLKDYEKWLKVNYGLSFQNYDEIWEWSISELEKFWESLVDYFDVKLHGKYETILEGKMPDATWFSGTSLNYAEHIFRNSSHDYPAIVFKQEGKFYREISWSELTDKVSLLSEFFSSKGIEAGDRIVAYLPNIPEATISFLAANSIGAIWSSCSPDFGSQSVIDRFKQIEPKVLLVADGYVYNGKTHDRLEVIKEIVKEIPTISHVVDINYVNLAPDPLTEISTNWNEIMSGNPKPLKFKSVSFDHPIWILYSSGTTGQPKAITHSTGGTLLEHLKYLAFHNDVKQGEKFFWYTTTGWMMWNFVQASMLVGATIVLYDGSPGYPDLNVLWEFASEYNIEHFGTSAPFILSCLKKGIKPNKSFDLSSIRSVSSTGAPLPSEGFDWIYEYVAGDVWLCSMSGGTDVCSAFVGGCPYEPVYEGEIQRRALGCALYSFDEHGNPIQDEVGEMVITKPMPSMPIYFWNDKNKSRYRESYFQDYEGIWRHGDWVKVTDRQTLVILGRSDATLNRHGIRIGTAEIYKVVDKIPEINDSLIVNIELKDGNHYMPLFVVLKEGISLGNDIMENIKISLKKAYSPRHVPDSIIEVSEIPYTISGKKMEAPVKKILMGIPLAKAANLGAMRNPESLGFFESFARQLNIK